MRTFLWSTLSFAALALVFATASCSGSRGEGLDTSKLPDDMRDDYTLFAHRCSKCHSLARPLSAGITDDAQWVMYVNRMRRQPGSGISLEDQEHILRFLRYYAAELRKKKDDARSAPAPAAPPPPPASSSPLPPLPAPAPSPSSPKPPSEAGQ